MLFMDPVWDSFPFYMTTVQSHTGTKITRVGSATDTKSDRSEFVFRPVPCKCMKRNVWRAIRTHTGPSSSRSHVITPLWVAYENQTAFLSLSKRYRNCRSTALLRFGREFIAGKVLSYDMRFSVLSLNTCSSSYTPSSVVHTANLEITQGV